MLYQFLIIDVDVGVDTTMAEVVGVDMVAIILGIVIAMVHPKTKKNGPNNQRGLLAKQHGHICHIPFCSSFFIFLYSIVMKFPFLAKPNPSAMFVSFCCVHSRWKGCYSVFNVK